MDNYQIVYHFIIRDFLNFEDVKIEIAKVLNIDESQLIELSALELSDTEDTLYYEFFTTVHGFKSYLTLHMIMDKWIKYRYKNSILDLGIMFSKALKQDIAVALYNPNLINHNDWVLIKPSGTIHRVKEKDSVSDYFSIDEILRQLSEVEIASMKQ